MTSPAQLYALAPGSSPPSENLYELPFEYAGKGLPATQKCKYGDEPATKRVVWADGRAYVPVCDKHLATAKRQLSDVVAVHDIPSPAHALQVEDDHSACEAHGELYGTAFCLSTHKPGPCKGQHRQGWSGPNKPAPVVHQRPNVAVPNAPAAKTAQQATAEQTATAQYQTALQNAQRLAIQLGGNPAHARVQGAVHDYARAMHAHGRAVTAADRARAIAQGKHNNAVARNNAINAANRAAQAAAIAKANAVGQAQKLRMAAARHPKPPPHHAAFTDVYTLYGLPDPDPMGLYAQPALAHWTCNVGEFCRNPLHPGPCKGWKHTLHAVAPGAYHAYEKQRVAKLNEQRKAKVQALKDAGKPVPKKLLTEITYSLPTKPQPGYTPPTPKEAQAALPVTAKEIGAKIALKHADIAAAKQKQLDSQHAAIVNIAEALGVPMGPGQQHVVKQKMQDVKASQTAGEKFVDHPVLAKTIDMLAEKASQTAGGLPDDQKQAIAKDIADHVEAGITELPILVQSAINAGKKPKAPVQAKQVLGDVASGPQGKLTKTGEKLGTHGAGVATDETGKQFLVKPHSPYGDFTSHGEVGASQLAQAVGLDTPAVHLTPTGTVQEMVPGGKDAFPGKFFNPTKLSSQDVLDLQKHQIVDWLVGNHDAHPGNFLRDKNGKLVEIDKGQAFKHYHEDQLSSDYHPNSAYGEQEPVYNTLLKAAKDGQVQLHSPAPGEPLGKFLDKVQGLPDDQLKAMFKPYATAAAQTGHLPGAPGGGKAGAGADPAAVEKFLADIVARKKSLKTDFQKLYLAHQAPSKMAKAEEQHVTEALDASKLHSDLSPNAKLVKIGKLSPADFGKLAASDKAQVAGTLAEIYGKEPLWAPVALNVAGKIGAKKHFEALATPATPGAAGKVSGPLAHPDMMKAYDEIKYGAGSKTEKLDALDKPTVTKAEFEKLSPSAQAAVTGFLNQAAEGAGPATHAKVQALKAKLAGGQSLADEAQKILDAPNASLTTKAQALTKEHFDALPAASQKQLIGKLKDLLGPDAGPAVSNKATQLIEKLTGMLPKAPGAVKPATSVAPLTSSAPAHVKHAQSLASGAAYATDTAKVAAYGKLSAAEFQGLPPEIRTKILADLEGAHAKFLAPAKKKLALNVLDKLQAAHIQAPSAAPAVAEQVGAIAKKQAAAHLEALKLAGLPSNPTLDSVIGKHYQEQGVNTIEHTASELALAWSKKHLDHLALSDAQKKALQLKAHYEFGDMIADGASHPLPGGVIDTAEKVDADVHGDDPFGTGKANALAKAIGQSLAAEKPAPKTPAVKTSAGLGKGKAITKIPDAAKSQLLTAYKNQSGSYLSSPAQDNYDNLLAVAHAHHGKPGFGSLSLSQVIDSIDETQAKKLGVANSGALKTKISDWLATPEGKKYALAAKPIPAKVEAISAGIVEPVKLPKGAKVPKLAGPGPYKAAQTDFSPHYHAETLSLQTKYQKETGTEWSPAQLAAIQEYTGSSVEINTWLRKGTGGASAQKQAINLQSAMLPIQQNTLLNRGTVWEQFPEGFRDPESVKKLVGKTISDPGFVSTAIAGESKGFSSKVHLEIEAPKGTMGAYVEHVTSVSSEYETILAAGTKFRVLKVSSQYGKTTVRLRVVS
jgi:hypothetical protein